ncbi:hypothetical protein KQX54_010025 [Cotesia glomerata]|uniref:Uncharacterized protein n=1 Tax=Cotesia glomerata TaxID=32391 RepID=A0AAV7IP27_COTGL|nr:hypothetical protein KQX54_010025 [Cotesia glomerata]
MKFITLIFRNLLFYSIILDRNSVMSERLSASSRDVISIIIPEDPDDNLNIDQLTLDFRRQLGRLIQRSRFNKLENNRFRYAPNDTKTLLKEKKTLKDHRRKLNINRYLISKFDRRTDSRYNRQGKKQPFYRSNLLKRLSSKRRGNVLQNKQKMRENKWRHINNFSQSNLVNNNINKNNRSSLDVINVENNSVNKRNSFTFNYRKRKLQSNKVLSNNKVNNYMILNPEDVEFSTLQKSNSIPDCLRKIDENDDYSNDPVSDFLSDNARHYDSINNQEIYLRNASQLYFDNENFPLRISRSVSNNQFSKTPTIHAR